MPRPPKANEEWVMTIVIPGEVAQKDLEAFKKACNDLIDKHKGRVIEVRLQPKSKQ